MADYSKEKKEVEAQIRGKEAQRASALEAGQKRLAETCASEIQGLKAQLAAIKSNERNRP